MSGIAGHTVYALLGLQAAARRRLPLAPLALRHFSSYLAGAYLGSDIQIVPAVTCVATGRPHGCCGMKFDRCPETGGAVEPWRLAHGGRAYSGAAIHALFYGRAHAVFGFTKEEAGLAIPWERLADYGGAALEDAATLFGPGERPVAYVLGWLAHVASDSLIKGFRAGIDLHMIDGKYTPHNRPVQDFYCTHEVGTRELGLDWPAVLNDLAETPVEAVQLHYMRVAMPRGRLGQAFLDDWRPDQQALLEAVLRENRRWFRTYGPTEIEAVRLVEGEVNAESRKRTGLNRAGVLALCEEVGYRRALGQMGELVADLLGAAARRSPALARRTYRSLLP